MPFTGRVLLVGPLEGTRWRSISVYTATLAAALRAHGVGVTIAHAPWFNPPSVLRGVRARWTRQPDVQAALRGEFDVVHLTDQALAHHVHRFRRHAPVVVTCHDLMPFTVPGYYHGRLEGLVKRAFLRRPMAALQHADAVVAVSEYTAASIAERRAASLERVRVIPNIVGAAFQPRPTGEAEPELARRGIVLPPRPRVLSVGHAGGYKNLPLLLRAMAEEPLAGASLVRVGSLRPEQQALAESLGIASRIHRLSALDDDSLALLFNACDALAQPSLAEGFGMPVVEAFASGLPVVSTDGGALGEVSGGAALTVPADPQDARAFADVLVHAFGNKEFRERGLRRAADFSAETIAARFTELYEQICRERMAVVGASR